LEDLGVYGEIILEWILRKYGGRCGLDAYGSEQGPAAGSCEYGNESSGSIKGEEFLN
jgi:hypothetical protein